MAHWRTSAGKDTLVSFTLNVAAMSEEEEPETRARAVEIIARLSHDEVCVVYVGDALMASSERGDLFEKAQSAPCVYEPAVEKVFAELKDLHEGDRGCALVLDDQAQATTVLADFTLCDERELLRGQSVYLTYAPTLVAAAACEGDMDCGLTESIRAVAGVFVRDSAGCGLDEVSVLSCADVSACWMRRHHKLRLQIDAWEAEFNQSALSAGSVPFAGGGGSWLRIRSGDSDYTLFSGVGKWGPGGGMAIKQGVARHRNGALEHSYPCTDDDSLLGPPWFEEQGLQPASGAFDFSSHVAQPLHR